MPNARASELAAARQWLWLLAENPGPYVRKGRIVVDAATGEPVLNMELKLHALRLLCELNSQVWALRGAA